MTKLLADEFKVLSRYIRSLTGIHLDPSKGYLIETRLGGLLAEENCCTFSELYFKAKSDPTGALKRRIIDAITTGETLFFRDSSPFDLLRHKILPELIDRRLKSARGSGSIPLRIWSAACSTGQEVYSIAIVLKELLGDPGRFDIRLIGTDISDKAITRASRGVYNRIEVQRGLPEPFLSRHFRQVEGSWRVHDEIRSMALFKSINLLDDFSSLGRFDIVFCRNVAIYFAEEDKVSLFRRIGRILVPDGSLVIGATESLSGICPEFESKRYLRSVFYSIRTPGPGPGNLPSTAPKAAVLAATA